MMANLLDMFFGCWHKNYGFPITVKPGQRRNGAASATGTYIVCLDCGREFPYDWKAMKIVSGGGERAGRLAGAVGSYVGE
ncbi:MAG TPA: hypothetical protein VFA60_04350 [Terriglobales bacterium]|nr:hypothetical protein [Terriglobales bacterium]